jgi:hypothetical protein
MPCAEPPAPVPDSRRPVFRRLWMFPVAGLSLLFLFLWFRPEAPRALAGINDFMGIYTGARLVGTPEQFSADASIREQLRATGWSAPSILYTRLPAFAVVLRPLGRLEYRIAYFVWQALSLASFAAFLWFCPTPDRRLLLFAACCSFPLFATLAGGQDIAFLALILAIVWRLEVPRPRSEASPVLPRPFLAGAVLGLTALKFHLFLLVPVFLIAQRRWRMLAGAATTVGVILITCFAAAGIDWIPRYIHFVLQGQTNPSVRAMPNLHGLLEGVPHSMAWEAVGAILVGAAAGRIAQHANFSLGLSTALVGSLLTSHHAYAADALLLLPALLTLAAEVPRVPLRFLCFLLLSPLPFLITPAIPLAAPIPLLLLALLIALTFVSMPLRPSAQVLTDQVPG